MSFLPAVKKRASASQAAPTSSFCWAVRVLWTPHQVKWTRTAAAVRRSRWAGPAASSGMSDTVTVLMVLLSFDDEGKQGRTETTANGESVVARAPLDPAAGPGRGLAVTAVDAGGRRRQAAAAGPGPQPLHGLGRGHGHRHDVLGRLRQRHVQEGRQPAARAD